MTGLPTGFTRFNVTFRHSAAPPSAEQVKAVLDAAFPPDSDHWVRVTKETAAMNIHFEEAYKKEKMCELGEGPSTDDES